MSGNANTRNGGHVQGNAQTTPSVMRKIPDFPIAVKLEGNPLRKKDSRFLCNIRFKNDLPEVRDCKDCCNTCQLDVCFLSEVQALAVRSRICTQ